MGRLVLVAALALASCAAPKAPRETDGRAAPPPAAVDRIATLRARVTEHPRLYPVWAHLGEAYLDRARLTHDAGDVRAAHEALETSLSIQENFEALKMMVALANFRHRFEEALAFGARAAEALPSDTSILSMRLEALAGLGRIDEAENLLNAANAPFDDFYVVTSRARLLIERGDVPGAIDAFRSAASIAHRREAPFFEAWADLRIAEQLIDSGRGEEAGPLLAAARRLGPKTRDLVTHEAEYAAVLGKAGEALARMEGLLAASDDPFLHAAAVDIARAAGDRDAVRRHIGAAERGLLAPVERGEVFTLEALAGLYSADGSPRALEFAQRNFEHKRDASAREVLDRARKAASVESRPR